MILELFALFLVISFVLIIIGLVKSEESAQALIGFFFLFLLGLVLINNNLEYETGEVTTIDNTFSGGNLTSSVENMTITYAAYNDSNTHNFGYWLCIVAVIGFALVLIGLKPTNWRRE